MRLELDLDAFLFRHREPLPDHGDHALDRERHGIDGPEIVLHAGRPVKGLDAPVFAWIVLRESENLSRFEASRSQGMTPFVGREHDDKRVNGCDHADKCQSYVDLYREQPNGKAALDALRKIRALQYSHR